MTAPFFRCSPVTMRLDLNICLLCQHTQEVLLKISYPVSAL